MLKNSKIGKIKEFLELNFLKFFHIICPLYVCVRAFKWSGSNDRGFKWTNATLSPLGFLSIAEKLTPSWMKTKTEWFPAEKSMIAFLFYGKMQPAD